MHCDTPSTNMNIESYQAFDSLGVCTQAALYDKVPIYIEVLCVMITYSLLCGYQYLKGKYCLQKSGWLQFIVHCLWHIWPWPLVILCSHSQSRLLEEFLPFSIASLILIFIIVWVTWYSNKLWGDQPGFKLQQGQDFPLFHNIQTGSWGRPSFLSNGYWGRFPWRWSGQGMKLTAHLCLVKSRMVELCLHSPICLHGIRIN
jgi:hypothetical protein